MSTSPERLAALRDFAARTLSDDSIVVEPASTDASFRSYWRVKSQVNPFGDGHIVMDAPPGSGEDIPTWLDINRRLRKANLNAPQVFGEDIGQGFVLMTDLGSRLYLWELDENSADKLYAEAFDAQIGMLTRVDTTGMPRYGEEHLKQELELFPEWFLKRHLGIEISCDEWDVIEAAFRLLINSALEQPQGFVHRDWHSRNLMIVPGATPGIVDFQGAVIGPVTYDAVSLLRDCYIEWPGERVYAWANKFRDRLTDKGVLKFGELRWKRWFDLMGLQRHLKVLGIFCRLLYRDGKSAYLKDLPLVLKYTLDIASKNKELANFATWVRKKVGGRDLTKPATHAA